MRTYREIAGEDLILIHRMHKNHVPSRDYVLTTEIARAGAQLPIKSLRKHCEHLEGIGETALWLTDFKQLRNS